MIPKALGVVLNRHLFDSSHILRMCTTSAVNKPCNPLTREPINMESIDECVDNLNNFITYSCKVGKRKGYYSRVSQYRRILNRHQRKCLKST